MTVSTLIQIGQTWQDPKDQGLVGNQENVPKLITPTIKMIRLACQKSFAVTDTDFFSPRRPKNLVKCRQVCAFLCREMTARSYPDMARMLHRDHSTLVYSAQKIRELLPNDPDLVKRIETIRAAIKAQLLPTVAI